MVDNASWLSISSMRTKLSKILIVYNTIGREEQAAVECIVIHSVWADDWRCNVKEYKNFTEQDVLTKITEADDKGPTLYPIVMAISHGQRGAILNETTPPLTLMSFWSKWTNITWELCLSFFWCKRARIYHRAPQPQSPSKLVNHPPHYQISHRTLLSIRATSQCLDMIILTKAAI